MIRCVTLLIIVLFLCFHKVLAQQPVKLGISPWTSPELLLAWTKPVEEALESQTGVAYQIASSTTLEQYMLDAVDGQFEVLLSPMHLGLYLIRYHGFKGVMFVRASSKLLVVTRHALSIDHLNQLKGTSMAVSEPVAVSTLIAKEAVANQLFKASLMPQKNHWHALGALQKKRVESAVVVDYLYLALSPPLKNRLKVLYEFPLALDGLLLAPPSSMKAFRTRITNSLLSFKPLKSSLLKGFEKITDKELSQWKEEMDNYVVSVHRLMKEKHFL